MSKSLEEIKREIMEWLKEELERIKDEIITEINREANKTLIKRSEGLNSVLDEIRSLP